MHQDNHILPWLPVKYWHGPRLLVDGKPGKCNRKLRYEVTILYIISNYLLQRLPMSANCVHMCKTASYFACLHFLISQYVMNLHACSMIHVCSVSLFINCLSLSVIFHNRQWSVWLVPLVWLYAGQHLSCILWSQIDGINDPPFFLFLLPNKLSISHFSTGNSRADFLPLLHLCTSFCTWAGLYCPVISCVLLSFFEVTGSSHCFLLEPTNWQFQSDQSWICYRVIL